VEQNIQNVNILLTCADNRNDNKTSTLIDGGPSNCGRGSDLMACLVGLRSHSWSHRGSLVCTESLCINVGYQFFLQTFFFNTYDTVHIVLIHLLRVGWRNLFSAPDIQELRSIWVLVCHTIIILWLMWHRCYVCDQNICATQMQPYQTDRQTDRQTD
jgi:hypothetical protein